MEENDLPEVTALFKRYMQRFDMAPELTTDDARHHFLSGRGEPEGTEPETNRRKGQVVWSYVVEVGPPFVFIYHFEHTSLAQDTHTHKVTDFFSFYSLPSTVINNPKHGVIEAAYLFYYASEIAFEDGVEENGVLKKRLERLIGDALIIAQRAKFDVFNALTLMDTVPILRDLKVGFLVLSEIGFRLNDISLGQGTDISTSIYIIGGLRLWQVWMQQTTSLLEEV